MDAALHQAGVPGVLDRLGDARGASQTADSVISVVRTRIGGVASAAAARGRGTTGRCATRAAGPSAAGAACGVACRRAALRGATVSRATVSRVADRSRAAL